MADSNVKSSWDLNLLQPFMKEKGLHGYPACGNYLGTCKKKDLPENVVLFFRESRWIEKSK